MYIFIFVMVASFVVSHLNNKDKICKDRSEKINKIHEYMYDTGDNEEIQ